MIGILWNIVKNTAALWIEKIFSIWFPQVPSPQKAVNTETKMAQDVSNEPSQIEIIKKLQDDQA